MTEDVYSEAIDAICEFYKIDRDVCIEHFWDEVEEYMKLKLLWHNTNNWKK